VEQKDTITNKQRHKAFWGFAFFSQGINAINEEMYRIISTIITRKILEPVDDDVDNQRFIKGIQQQEF
jgi:hypothetical protein